MAYRSMAKTDPDKMKDIEQKNPENNQVQSIQSNALYSTSESDAPKNNDRHRLPGMS